VKDPPGPVQPQQQGELEAGSESDPLFAKALALVQQGENMDITTVKGLISGPLASGDSRRSLIV